MELQLVKWFFHKLTITLSTFLRWFQLCQELLYAEIARKEQWKYFSWITLVSCSGEVIAGIQ